MFKTILKEPDTEKKAIGHLRKKYFGIWSTVKIRESLRNEQLNILKCKELRIPNIDVETLKVCDRFKVPEIKFFTEYVILQSFYSSRAEDRILNASTST